MNDYKVTVKELQIKKEMQHKDTPVLTYSISYPELSSQQYKFFISRLNQYYQNKAFSLVRYCENDLYKRAMDYFDEYTEKNYPFHEYELSVVFTVTDNERSVLSLYLDEYIYTGGANGTTERASDSFNMLKGRRIEPAELFPIGKNYAAVIEDEVIRQIGDDIKYKDGNYFDDYKNLVKEYFDPKNFYLTPSSLAVYFQEVTIAPHSSGIVVFEIPYVNGPVRPESYEY